MKSLAVGLMSGTSADGVSVALASFKQKSFELIDHKTFPYQKEISNKILNVSHLKVSEISSLNFRLGEVFAGCALNMMRRNRLGAEQVAVIGSHGQTIFHGPSQSTASTFQIGEPAVVAEKTGITVISDFRTRDIAAGGEGAPLIPFFDHYFFGNEPVRAFQNIGGIGNVAVVGKSIRHPIAFDTGPGNCLLDWAVRKISGGRLFYDLDGKMAKKGRVLMNFVSKMANHPYFRKSPPKSTGREIFNELFLPAELKNLLRRNPEDVLATLTYFTAFTIAQSYKRFIHPHLSSFPISARGGSAFGGRGEERVKKLKEVIVSGGGSFNKTLINDLQNLLNPVPVCSIQKYGIHPQAKEPLAFAFFALRAIEGKINHLPLGTGAKKARILGKITPGKNYRGIS